MVTDDEGTAASVAPPISLSRADRFCDAVDRINSWVGRSLALTIFIVTGVILIEVFARSVLGQATSWANETTIYLSACAYLLSGGYALAHRSHVRIDVIYERLTARTRTRLDLHLHVLLLVRGGAHLGRQHARLDLVPSS